MEVRDWILIVSSLIVVGGWFVNSELNRRHEISKKRLDLRLEMLLAFIEIFLQITTSKSPFEEHKNLLGNIAEVRKKFQLYGKDDEIQMFEEFVQSIENADLVKLKKSLEQLIELVKSRLRKELRI